MSRTSLSKVARSGFALLAVPATLFAADSRGEPTVVLPMLILLSIWSVLRQVRRSTLDRWSWILAAIAIAFAMAGFAGMAMGYPVHHPLVTLAFVAVYPIQTISQFQFIRVRSMKSQAGNWVDGAIAAFLVGSALMQWVVPWESNKGSAGWIFFVAILFPILGVLAFGSAVTLGSVVRWRFPAMLGWLVFSQVLFVLSDVFPLVEHAFQTANGLGARSAAIGYIAFIVASFCNSGWTATEGESDRSTRVLSVVWAASLLALAMLLHPAATPLARASAAAAIVFVLLRLSMAYGEARLTSSLRVEARTDELTGLPNRRALRERLDAHIELFFPFTILLLDLDEFKEINDALGHDAGDQLLRTVAARLSRAANQYEDGCELFRLGGDEFAAIVKNPAKAAELAREMVSLVRVPTIIEAERIDQGVSIGGASFPIDAPHPGDLVRLADASMYRAKQLNSGFEHHDSSLIEEFSSIRLLSIVRSSLKSGSFELHYQPQISLVDGSVVGVEALFRLKNDGRYLPAETVIRVAGSAGILSELTDRVIDRAIEQLTVLHRTHPLLTMSLNVSEQDLSSGTLTERILPVLRRNGVAPSQLCIEVTEESLLHDPTAAARTVDELRAAGLAVSMDDFGVGFSSLTNLRVLAVDELKIDRSFVAGLVGDPRTEALVVSIVELASRLGAKVMIEGVEQLDEVTMARSLGIDLVQGYLFARPLPFDNLRKWLIDYNPATIDFTSGRTANSRSLVAVLSTC
jgi:diguanylate cyclase